MKKDDYPMQNQLSKLRHLKLFLLISIMTIPFSSIAQEKPKAEDSYLEYFKLPRETLFLHTNKTTYLANEDIWFKAYAYDRKNALTSKTTTNIHLGLYDEKGNQIDKKLYLAKEGAAIGNYTLDSLIASGEYYLKISTNWMKNFEEDDAYIQKIRIINPKVDSKLNKEASKKAFDFQFLPEGGHILEGVKNNIGIKVIDDKGKGIKASGTIIGSDNEEIASFTTNNLGIGKFSLTPEKGESYTAKIKLQNGAEFDQDFPKIDEIGVAIAVNNLKGDKTIITLSVNDASFDFFSEDRLKLLLHKDGNIKSIPILIDKKTKQIVISKKTLFPGVNTVTIFNSDEKPLVERMFFNPEGAIKNYDLYLSKTGIDLDSISYQLRTNSQLEDEILNASISVLPARTKSYDPDHNIISAIHLKPYVKGTIENPQYYFREFTRKKQFELDALLLTQGWSRYSWDRVFNLPPKPSFDFENGISVNGFLNNFKRKKVKSLLLYPTKLNKSTFIPVDTEGKFNIKNFYPTIGEEVRFSYQDNSGKMKRPNMSLSYVQLFGKDQMNTEDYQSFLSYYQDKNEIPDQFIIDDSYEQLDEIQIKTDYKKRLREEMRDPMLVNGKVTKVTPELAERYRLVLDLIQNSGYDVFYGDGLSSRLGSVQILSRTRGSQGVPAVFVDNLLVTELDFLSTLNMDQVDRVIIDRTGVGLGISASNGGFGGAIKIFTRKSILGLGNETDSVKNMFISVSSTGFEPTKEFYTPKYASYNLISFKNYGVIHWEPNMNIKSNSSDELKIIDTELDEINFYIEGISSDGSVFSQIINVNTFKD